MSASAVELAERVRGYWLEAGVVVELEPSRYALTANGERLTSGLLADERDERAT